MSQPDQANNKATIIIAAYNEATTIRETLKSLYVEEALNTYRIIVVCNGCSDGTENIVRSEFPKVICHSLPRASKALAIRFVESLKPGFPRLYLDADITLTSASAMELILRSNSQKQPHLLIPNSTLNAINSSNLVKGFYRVWYNTHHVQTLGYGTGAYLINACARTRFDIWPELIADDAFIRSQFSSNELYIAKEISVEVKAPRTFWSLVKIKTRSKLGNLELNSYTNKNNIVKPTAVNTGGVKKINANKTLWLDYFVYFLVNVLALSCAKWQLSMGKKTWHRDDSNRQ